MCGTVPYCCRTSEYGVYWCVCGDCGTSYGKWLYPGVSFLCCVAESSTSRRRSRPACSNCIRVLDPEKSSCLLELYSRSRSACAVEGGSDCAVTRVVASCAPARIWARWRQISSRQSSFEAIGEPYRGKGLIGSRVSSLCTRSGLVYARILLPTEKNAVPSIGEHCRGRLLICKLLGVRAGVL
jgi:hypothetical protein